VRRREEQHIASRRFHSNGVQGGMTAVPRYGLESSSGGKGGGRDV